MTGRPAPFLRALLVLLLAGGLFVLYAQAYLGLSFPRLGKVLFANYSYASHLEVRTQIVRYQLLQAPKDRTIVVLGDSIAEGALWPSICGASVINGGIGGASLLTVLDVMPAWLDRRFEAIVIAAGVNDAARLRPTPVPEFRARLERILARAKEHSRIVVMSTVLPVETGGPLGESAFDPGLIAAYDGAIRELAGRSGTPLVDLSQAFAVPDRGPMSSGATLDGVHLAPHGYATWLGAMTHAVTTALQCGAAG